MSTDHRYRMRAAPPRDVGVVRSCGCRSTAAPPLPGQLWDKLWDAAGTAKISSTQWLNPNCPTVPRIPRSARTLTSAGWINPAAFVVRRPFGRPVLVAMGIAMRAQAPSCAPPILRSDAHRLLETVSTQSVTSAAGTPSAVTITPPQAACTSPDGCAPALRAAAMSASIGSEMTKNVALLSDASAFTSAPKGR